MKIFEVTGGKIVNRQNKTKNSRTALSAVVKIVLQATNTNVDDKFRSILCLTINYFNFNYISHSKNITSTTPVPTSLLYH